MDNLTHSLVGAVLGQAGLKRKTGLAMPALIIGANLPDVDTACFFWLDGLEHLAFRRGITHGPPALVLLPLILAGLLWGFDRWQTKRGAKRFGRPEEQLPVSFGWLFALAFIGCLTHPALDWLNVYGIRLLEPLSSQWFYGDTLFIIDPWLWAMLIAGIWVSRRQENRGGEWMRPARVGIAVGLAYIGVNGAISAAKPEPVDATAEVINSPLPVLSLAREHLSGGGGLWFYWDDSAQNWIPIQRSTTQCALPDFTAARRTNSQLDAFLFWSRAPFLTLAPDGSVILRDARFTDPRAGDRFALALPDVQCEELPKP